MQPSALLIGKVSVVQTIRGVTPVQGVDPLNAREKLSTGPCMHVNILGLLKIKGKFESLDVLSLSESVL